MLNFLKNRLFSLAVNTSPTNTFLTASVIGDENNTLLEDHQQQKLLSKIEKTTSENHLSSSFHVSLLADNKNIIRIGSNLMDEAYFLNKFEEYEKNDCWDYVFQVWSKLKKNDQHYPSTSTNGIRKQFSHHNSIS